MKLRIAAKYFFALYSLVLLSQNAAIAVTKPATASQASAAQQPSVANFPSEGEARDNWKKLDPQSENQTEKGPAPNPGFGPGGARSISDGQISASTLPNPKVDYVKEAVSNVAPMTATQMRAFADEMYRRSLEMSRVPGGPYKMQGTRMAKVNLAPGAPPESISVALGMGTMVSFVDRTGAPLVIDAIEGFSNAFVVRVMKTESTDKNGSHLFSIDARKLTGQGSVSVQLRGVRSPVFFNVNVGKSTNVDGHVEFILPVVSSARVILPGDRMESDTAMMIPEMEGFLAGIPPEGAVEVMVTHVGDTTAWMWKNKLYLRTVHTVFTPAWYHRQGSADGTAVYELPLTPVIILGVEGRETQALLNFPYIPTASSKQ